jgi:hypothetical protein
MSLYIKVPGQRIRAARLKRGMGVEEFAKLICCLPEDLRALEEGRYDGQGIGVCLGHSRFAYNVNILALDDDDKLEANLFNLELHEAKSKAFQIIVELKLTESYPIVKDVMRQISRKYELMISERELKAIAFRERNKVLQINEEVVRDLVSEARRRLRI